ncbi:hypothetical protein LY28_00011 [Ruminiclostridium sufflavum DSM 19573]|uniref:DUF1565 domain-containing protein n=1 Tax=Ruminiclostridium sufflavum DSM 19573 TaxID=1121337 RepID=A0A318XPA6_9FIRM|nr:hypothetical protein [Ruminiclostridium sufflavum]PYG90131.1 hypothetical protein LY28_00011 [Ruminiclostridium sufflavum DSM 19573]
MNKYCNLYGENKIKDEYQKINNGFELVQGDVENVLNSESGREVAETQREVNEVNRQLRYANTKHYGEYNPITVYHTNNIVSYFGSSYMLKENTDGTILESQGYAPPEYPQEENDRWKLVGKKGDKGDTGAVPNIQIGTVTTLQPGNTATVSRHSGSPDTEPIFDFGIPKGIDGTGAGDMTKSVYDTDNSGIVDDAERLGGQLPGYYAKANDLSVLNATVINRVPFKTTNNIAYYVRTDGSDLNDGSANDSAHAFLTISKAINAIPQIVNHDVLVSIAPGTYNEDITVSGHSGQGGIRIIGANSLADSVNYIITGKILVKGHNCANSFLLQGIKTTYATNGGFSIRFISGSNLFIVQYCTVAPVSYVTGSYGIWAYAFSGNILNCNVSNINYAIGAANNNILSGDNGGSGNNIVLTASNAGIIGKRGTQPTGDIAEQTNNGGAIRA